MSLIRGRMVISPVHLRIDVLIVLYLFSALTKVYEKANSVLSYDVSCPTWLHKYIIGKKGATIQKLTNELPKVSEKLSATSLGLKKESTDDILNACHLIGLA